jgi:hypothetical protein
MKIRLTGTSEELARACLVLRNIGFVVRHVGTPQDLEPGEWTLGLIADLP